MEHADDVALLRDGVGQSGGAWADLGSGHGAFTLALADLLGGSGTITSVDRDAAALRAQQQAMSSRFPGVIVRYLAADFTRTLDLPPLDGVLMANALHFVRDKGAVLQTIRRLLKAGGRLVLVEYNADQGNVWVPHPLSYPTWEALARRSGLERTRLLATTPSRFLKEIYSALSFKPADPAP